MHFQWWIKISYCAKIINYIQKFCSDSEIKEYVDFFLEYVHTSFMDNEFDCFV